ncbi:hypothetical protein FN846DRAFT_963335 [Sphaerosporella brunnea]|uniref:Uncharacterized protein n=1 Tax=Sphaerosporella brunnea TaxID=1250544 RepID=A0A5J5EIE0_9PEZI|nr:hypothetical protein FN846DRAFT_971618 [Sphaerosporella brunnea]KAA8897642.1 hypothetical protein FN846DRAFT_963335 [Sphaerosporella brunnea]
MPSDAVVQAALNTYSVAVQRYKALAELLPPPVRPPVLERFQHRNNRWAVQRRTADVRKAIERMERQLKGLTLQQVAPPLDDNGLAELFDTPPPLDAANDDGKGDAANQGVVPQAPPPAPVGVTSEEVQGIMDQQHSANPFRRESDTGGRQHRAGTPVSDDGVVQESVAADMPCYTGQRPRPTGSTDNDHSVGPDNMECKGEGKEVTASTEFSVVAGDSPDDDAARVVDTGLTNSDSFRQTDVPAPDSAEDAFSAADEIHAIVRVGVVSPATALRMTRLVEQLKADGASPAIVKKVYTTFLRGVEDRATIADMESAAMNTHDDGWFEGEDGS